MTVNTNAELIKRIARLVRQNQDLEAHIRQLEEMNESLRREYEKSRTLIEKLRPGGIGDTGKAHGKGRSHRFNMATVLFAEVHGFDRLVGGMDSSFMMDELDDILFEFDAIVKRYKIEKIKTIGDTIMCAGGIPVKNITNTIDVVMAAVEMQHFLERHEYNKRGNEQRIWYLKVGIHTGPVTATSSGKKKVNYDITGDTVNTASRVKTVAENGSILISVMTYELVKEFFNCEYFGKLPVKYKGDLQMYRINGLHPAFSQDEAGIVPNEAFRIKFGLVRFTDMQEMILDKLERELPDYLFYHKIGRAHV